MTEQFRVVRTFEGEMSIDPGNFDPKPELVVSVDRNGNYSLVFDEEAGWEAASIAGSLYIIGDAIMERAGYGSSLLPDVQDAAESDSQP